MIRRSLLWALWIGFIIYGFFLSPPIQPDIARLESLLSGDWTNWNAVVLSLFSLIGMWLMIYSCVLFADGRMQGLPAWAFLSAAAGTGVIGLLPYLALRDDKPYFSGKKNAWLRFVDSKWTGALISISTLTFVIYGIIAGDWAQFAQQWQTSRFIHVMSLAFCLFALLFPTVLRDDMARRGLKSDRLFWLISLIPLFGPLAYLCLRPPLQES